MSAELTGLLFIIHESERKFHRTLFFSSQDSIVIQHTITRVQQHVHSLRTLTQLHNWIIIF